MAGLLLAATSLWPDLAFAAGGDDPFTQGVKWFTGGPAKGVAMLGVVAIAVALWFFAGSLRLAGMVLGGALIIANIDTIVGWFGF